jgi:hypothetical protein
LKASKIFRYYQGDATNCDFFHVEVCHAIVSKTQKAKALISKTSMTEFFKMIKKGKRDEYDDGGAGGSKPRKEAALSIVSIMSLWILQITI